MKDLNKNSEKKDYKCNLCQDTGVVIVDYNTAKQCECVKENLKRKRMENILEFADIPIEYENLNLKNFKIDIYKKPKSKELAHAAFTLVDRYIKNYLELEELGKGLYLYSEIPGSGKTSMAIILANEIMNLFEKSIRYTTVEDIASTIKSTYNNQATLSEMDIIKGLVEVDLLILDDLGVENNSQWTESKVYPIIDKRNEQKKPTIFTANIPINRLPYHSRIKSRLNRISTTIHFPEEDVRSYLGQREDEEVLKILFGSDIND